VHVILLLGCFFGLLFIFGLLSEKLAELSISAPLVFTILGVLFSFTEGVEQFTIGGENIELIGQIALIAILFTDASSISLKNFFKVYTWPVRMLFIGLPLTMLIGSIVAIPLFPEFDWITLAIMALILSPTDAALGQAVVQSEKVPFKIRESINVESGLNDGLALPPILILAGMLIGKGELMTSSEITTYILKQIIIGPAVGAALGWLGSKIINWSVRKQYSEHFFQGIAIVAIAIMAFVVADELGGNGYMSAFCAGMFFNADSKKTLERGQEFGEFLSQPLALFVFFVFGATILPHYIEFITVPVVIFSFLSLTVLRMIPVIISLIGTKIPMREQVFMAWFGPRGIASILYFLLMVNNVPELKDQNTIWATVILTVALSIFFHGVSAVPYANWLGKQKNQHS